MFVQLIEGRAGDEAALRSQWDLWLSDLAPGAAGWLGSTAGVSDDGIFVATARFESEEAARLNSSRREQGQWWAETEKLLDGPAAFVNASDIDLLVEGGSDDAGFVQVMHAQVSDPTRLRTIEREGEEAFRRLRPDFMGGLRAWYGQRGLVAVDYFTSEAEARKGEAKELTGEVKKQFEEWFSLLDGLRFIDITRPWMASAAQ